MPHRPDATPTADGAGRRVLVADDEGYIRDLLTTALRFVGYEVAPADDGYEALRVIDEFQPDLILLDVMMPGVDGYEVCRRLRDRGDQTPVIFLTARDGGPDKLTGFGTGADDYVTKPFDLEEVLARIHAVLKRGRADTPDTTVLSYADLELDDTAHQVRRAGELVDLSPTEYRLLRYLLANAERVLSKAQILDQVWEYDFDGDASVVETYVFYLRRKLDRSGLKLIHTVRGVGYTLRRPES